MRFRARKILYGLLVAAVSAATLRRLAEDQYWGWRNRIWTDGWTSASECAEQHLAAYDADPEKYVAEHGRWWRTDDREQQ